MADSPFTLLIVQAHPEPASFCAAMARTAAQTATTKGWGVLQSDLYAMGFDPVAKAEDFCTRRDPDYLNYALEQRQALETGGLAQDIEGEVAKLEAADGLLLVFPLYWFSVPAILKGWFDRCLLSGRAYGGRRFYEAGGYRGKRAAIALSLGGRTHMLTGPDSVHGDLADMLRPITRGTLGYCGFDVVDPFIAWHVPYVGEDTRRGYLRDLESFVAGLATAPVTQPPSLAGFDDRMRPI